MIPYVGNFTLSFVHVYIESMRTCFFFVEAYIILHRGHLLFVSGHICVIICGFRSCSVPVSCHKMVLGRKYLRLIGRQHIQWMKESGGCLVSGARVLSTTTSRDLTSLL